MRSDLIGMVLSFIAGTGIGLFFFGGLWLTVSRMHRTRHPALLSLASFCGRAAISMLALYCIMDGNWQRLMVSMAGFLLVRFILVRFLGPTRSSVESHVQ